MTAVKIPTRLGAVLAGAVKAPPVIVSPPGTPAPLTDACGCFKDPGCYGSEGFHLRRFDESDVQREIERALLRLPENPTEDDRKIVTRNAREFASRYLGTAIAYEPCRAYRDALARRAAATRINRAAQAKAAGGGNDLLED